MTNSWQPVGKHGYQMHRLCAPAKDKVRLPFLANHKLSQFFCIGLLLLFLLLPIQHGQIVMVPTGMPRVRCMWEGGGTVLN